MINLHIKAIVNADNESIDKLGKYFAQIAVVLNENAFEGFKTMYDYESRKDGKTF